MSNCTIIVRKSWIFPLIEQIVLTQKNSRFISIDESITRTDSIVKLKLKFPPWWTYSEYRWADRTLVWCKGNCKCILCQFSAYPQSICIDFQTCKKISWFHFNDLLHILFIKRMIRYASNWQRCNCVTNFSIDFFFLKTILLAFFDCNWSVYKTDKVFFVVFCCHGLWRCSLYRFSLVFVYFLPIEKFREKKPLSMINFINKCIATAAVAAILTCSQGRLYWNQPLLNTQMNCNVDITWPKKRLLCDFAQM